MLLVVIRNITSIPNLNILRESLTSLDQTNLSYSRVPLSMNLYNSDVSPNLPSRNDTHSEREVVTCSFSKITKYLLIAPWGIQGSSTVQ